MHREASDTSEPRGQGVWMPLLPRASKILRDAFSRRPRQVQVIEWERAGHHHRQGLWTHFELCGSLCCKLTIDINPPAPIAAQSHGDCGQPL